MGTERTEKHDDNAPQEASSAETQDRRTMIKGTLAAAAATGAAFAPAAKAVAGDAGLSPGLDPCAEPSQIECTAQALETVRQTPTGADELHAIAQQVAEGQATTQQLEFLAKMYGKAAQIRGDVQGTFCVDTLAYHY